jgi:hypothetical protein
MALWSNCKQIIPPMALISLLSGCVPSDIFLWYDSGFFKSVFYGLGISTSPIPCFLLYGMTWSPIPEHFTCIFQTKKELLLFLPDSWASFLISPNARACPHLNWKLIALTCV